MKFFLTFLFDGRELFLKLKETVLFLSFSHSFSSQLKTFQKRKIIMSKLDLNTLENANREKQENFSEAPSSSEEFPAPCCEESLFADDDNTVYDLRRINTERPVGDVLRELLSSNAQTTLAAKKFNEFLDEYSAAPRPVYS